MKQFNEIEWDEYNIYKNEIEHQVKYFEIEEAFENPHILLQCKVKKKDRRREKRMTILGRTIEGRYLFIVFEDKGQGIARPISARDMEKDERRYYEKKIKR